MCGTQWQLTCSVCSSLQWPLFWRFDKTDNHSISNGQEIQKKKRNIETQEVKAIKENLTTGVDHVNLIVFYSICFVLIGILIIIYLSDIKVWFSLLPLQNFHFSLGFYYDGFLHNFDLLYCQNDQHSVPKMPPYPYYLLYYATRWRAVAFPF